MRQGKTGQRRSMQDPDCALNFGFGSVFVVKVRPNTIGLAAGVTALTVNKEPDFILILHVLLLCVLMLMASLFRPVLAFSCTFLIEADKGDLSKIFENYKFFFESMRCRSPFLH